MKVYVATVEPYHDNSEIVGVYRSRDEALAAIRESVGDESLKAGEPEDGYSWVGVDLRDPTHGIEQVEADL